MLLFHQIAQECSSLPRNYCQWPAGTGVDPCLSPCFSSSSPPSSSPDLLPMRTCFMSPSQLSPSAYIVDGSTEYREILYACNPSWRCSHIHLRPRLHSSSSPYGPDHFTIQYYYGPGFFFSIFLLAPLPFIYYRVLVHFLRRVSLTWTVAFIPSWSPIPYRKTTLYGALLKGKKRALQNKSGKRNDTLFYFSIFPKIILFGDPLTSPVPVWNRLKIELIGLGPRRIGSILTPPILPTYRRQTGKGRREKKKKAFSHKLRIQYKLPYFLNGRRRGGSPFEICPDGDQVYRLLVAVTLATYSSYTLNLAFIRSTAKMDV